MKNPKEDLEAIMDLLEEWRKESGVDNVTMWISTDGTGIAYDHDELPSCYEVFKEYGKTETPGAATPRESK